MPVGAATIAKLLEELRKTQSEFNKTPEGQEIIRKQMERWKSKGFFAEYDKIFKVKK